MLRRLLAALLVAAITLPAPAFARSGCSMTEPWLSVERCDCCKAPASAPAGHCSTVAAVQSACGCALRADSGSQPIPVAAFSAPAASFDLALIPASLSTPQRSIRAVHLGAAPPGAGSSVSRPTLCIWII